MYRINSRGIWINVNENERKIGSVLVGNPAFTCSNIVYAEYKQARWALAD